MRCGRTHCSTPADVFPESKCRRSELSSNGQIHVAPWSWLV
jgi:hypothetical protein